VLIDGEIEMEKEIYEFSHCFLASHMSIFPTPEQTKRVIHDDRADDCRKICAILINRSIMMVVRNLLEIVSNSSLLSCGCIVESNV
jgi:hypothetical protein